MNAPIKDAVDSETSEWQLVCYMPKPVDEEALREAALNIVRLGLDTAPYEEKP